jgi:drug/metabolite transporter (DMT)-like permease
VTPFLAIGAAAVYGAGDFFGGVASRRADPLRVGAIAQLSGLLLGVLVLPFLDISTTDGGQLAWAVAAGVCGGLGVVGLYAALASGPMSATAPIAGVCAAAIPVIVGATLGERLSGPAIVGIVFAIVAIGLVSRQQRKPQPAACPDSQIKLKKSLALATVAGIALGLFFTVLAEARAQGSPWLLVVARIVSAAMVTGIVAWRRPLTKAGSTVKAAAAGAGLLDMLGGILYVLVVQTRHLAVVGVLASLYPVSTVILARTVLRERISYFQKAGILCALAAILLIGIP